MSAQVLTNCKLYADGYDFSGVTNKMTLSTTVADKDISCFGVSAVQRACGLQDVKFQHDGFGDPTTSQDAQEHVQVGGAPITLNIAPQNGAVGEPSYFGTFVNSSLGRTLQIGEPWAFAVQFNGSGDLFKGLVLQAATAPLVAGNGSAVQLGAVSATQFIYVAVNTIAFSGTGGPTLTLTIKSAAAANLAGATTRVTVPAITGLGGVFCVPVAGPVTDTWWTANVSMSGSTPSFTAIVSVAIQ